MEYVLLLAAGADAAVCPNSWPKLRAVASHTLRKRKLVSRGSPVPTHVAHTTSAAASRSFSRTCSVLHIAQLANR